MPRGLLNIGNTCSINSLIQCIANSTVIRRFLTEYPIKVSHDGRWSLTAELAGLVRDMSVISDDNAEPIAPRKFLEAFFEKAQFLRHGEQHDICEVWMILCETVAKECSSRDVWRRYNVTAEEAKIWGSRHGNAYAKAVLQYSKTMKSLNKDTACMWLELIQGVLIAQVKCKFCNEIYHNFEPFTALCVDIPRDGATIAECIDDFFHPEILSDWKCDHCGCKRDAEKVVQFWKLPAVLCISIRRFVHGNDGNVSKNRAAVQVTDGINIDINSVIGPQRYGKHGTLKYKLRSVGLHHGCLGGGHYTAITYDGNERKLIDDDLVRSLGDTRFVPANDVYFMIYDIS